jgi:transposase-like protein
MEDDNSIKEEPPGLVSKLEREAETVTCPGCRSKDIIHFGSRGAKGERTQTYRCKGCNKRFTTRPIKNVSYPVKSILRALTLYDQGYSMYETADIMKAKYKTHVPNSTLSNWIKRYEGTFTFLPLRRKYKIDPEDSIKTTRFHHQQVYDMRYHRLKLNIADMRSPRCPDTSTSLPTTQWRTYSSRTPAAPCMTSAPRRYG